MIINDHETQIVSNIGWTDGGNLWVYDTTSDQHKLVQLDCSDFLTVSRGSNDLFSVIHHSKNKEPRITVHSFETPEIKISEIVFSGTKAHFDGDANAWSFVPSIYSAYYSPDNDYRLIIIDGQSRSIQLQTLDWYNSKDYDLGYEGIVGATRVPGSSLVIVSIQRRSDLVLHDPDSGKLVGKIMLAGCAENPKVVFRKDAEELWANDYDTLVRLNRGLCIDRNNWTHMKKIRLQEPDCHIHHFIGSFVFDRDEKLCAVARPFSEDVLALNADKFVVTHRAETGGEPLKVSLMSDHRVYARDWHTGELLKSTLVSYRLE